MVKHVISHRKPRRKRGGAWSFVLRRFGALAVTVAALVTASWLAPRYYRPAPPPPQVEIVEAPAPPPKLPPPAEVAKLALRAELAGPAAAPPSPRRARRGVPLDANTASAGEDFEILSATELEAISQARN
jgi:hypothetical protein